jgi:uncharacterized protein (TIGR02217 family)
MANTAWSTTDKSASINLTNGNLTITAAGVGGGVRAADRQITGKFYWEVTATTWGASSVVGAAAQGASLAGASPALWCNVTNAGAIQLAGVNTGSSLGARANGDVIGIALDLVNQLIWFRVAPAGNWNGNASAAPNTGVGGISLVSIGNTGVPLYPYAFLNTSGHTYTANFGDSAFSGAVPAGFTSGLTAGASIPTNALATQSALEEWAATNAPAQVTQVALEEWATTTSVATQALVTQVALEQWASAGAPPLAGVGEVDAAATVTGAGATITVARGAGEADAGATVTGAGAVTSPGAGRVDAGATVTGAGAVITAVSGAGEVDAGADVRGAGFAAAVGTGEVDAFADVRGMGALVTPPGALPFLPGLGWSVHRRPTFDTITVTHASGAEVRLALWTDALWEFELSYDALASNAAYPGAGNQTLQTLMGFYLARGGQRGSFLFIDPDFNTMVGQGIGAGDGTTVAFQFVRVFGGQVEAVSWVTGVDAIYLDGVPTPSGWQVAGSEITFASAPASGVVISADFRYGFICRFLEDMIDFEQFMDNLWQLKSLKFRQVRL